MIHVNFNFLVHTFLIEWLVTRMSASRPCEYDAVIDIDAADIDVEVAITIPHTAVNGSIAVVTRSGVDARARVQIKLCVALMNECFRCSTISIQRA